MPPRQLRGFEKVFLKPGERRRVRFRLGWRDLSYWSEEAKDWVVPEGECRAMVGGSSRDVHLEVDFASGR
jgi:beta-glucosidase